ncbi:sigma 54-interacting transcriptional regulator [Desulfovibrio aminophilus]|uniref:sigma 54-interacting transcriptional regulator n=1 Tax=Desulfovibrio aminophilus TaxID=81425 RepID=UPI00041D55BA|nr:sigma-54 dependent transcriptional regulator [Desulfovibrio aminophilus]
MTGPLFAGTLRQLFANLSIRAKLLVTVIPSVVLILAVTGYATYRISSSFIETALERTVRVQNMATAHALTRRLDQCRTALLLFSQENLSPGTMREFLAKEMTLGAPMFREFAFLPAHNGPSIFLLVQDGQILRVPPERLREIRPNPILSVEKAASLEHGEVWISPVVTTEYPAIGEGDTAKRTASPVIRLVTPCDAGPAGKGLLVLSLDARDLRNLLSLYNSSKSPLWAFTRSGELRYHFLLDTDGWILLQSSDPDRADDDLATYLARSGYEGTLGRAHLPMAFRPNEVYHQFWTMVADLRDGKSGGYIGENGGGDFSGSRTFFMAYAPIYFTPVQGEPPQIYAGLAFLDHSKLTLAAGYKHLDVMFLITLLTIAAVAGMVFFLAKAVTSPILRLAKAVGEADLTGGIQEIDLPSSGYETNLLKRAVNKMLAALRLQLEEIRIRDQAIHNQSLNQRVIEDEDAPEPGDGQNPIPGILGAGPKIEELRSDILKAARVDVDVLIIGETGTGKQLAAEAIHNLSSRTDKPFISINCGALDENLLLDTLFGHVKGAFTEAKTDRKGAFLEADGGTLFLDEIQSASPKVQQALLRSVAMRKIKPLGSDQELDVDVRLVAATNADLTELIERRLFREDLYFRLKVITLHTPALREHKESIPILARAYLRQAETLVNKQGLALSRGALEKMKNYNWPGNIRELINCITRAAVMAEGDLILAEDVRLEGDGRGQPSGDGSSRLLAARPPAQPGMAGESRPAPGPVPPSRPLESYVPEGVRLSSRQLRVLPLIVTRGEVTRNDYQELAGGGLPSRTAIYDLQDLVKKGVLLREGRGPATRYVLARSRE